MKKCICGFFALFLIVFVFTLRVTRNDTLDVVVYGPIKLTDVLGQQTVNLVRGLKRVLNVTCVSTGDVADKIPRKIRPFMKNEGDVKAKVHLFQDSLWEPSSGAKFAKYIAKMPQDCVRIAYSMIETSRVPQEWVLILNCYFDALVVPDRFLIDIYQKSGVQIPIFEIPLAFNLEPFLKMPLKTKVNKAVITFANFNACIDRHNQITLIRAFAKAFGNRDDVLLKINSREFDPFLKTFLEYEIKELGSDNIIFTNFNLRKKNYLRFFQTIDCYVSCSKGEGFSIETRQSMALGIPVIATNNSAQVCMCKENLVLSVPSEIQEPGYLPNFGKVSYGHFMNCEVEDLARAFLEVYNNYDAYLAKGFLCREWSKQFRLKEVSKVYLNLVKPKKVVFGSENKITSEYLMTNSKELYQKYKTVFSLVGTSS